MIEEILKEKTVMVGVLIYGAQGVVGSELEYSEFEAGNSLFGYPNGSFPLGLSGVKVEDYDEKYWLNGLVEGLKVFLSLDDTFVDVKELVIDLSTMPSETLDGLTFCQVEDIEEFLKKKIKHEKFDNLKIKYM